MGTPSVVSRPVWVYGAGLGGFCVRHRVETRQVDDPDNSATGSHDRQPRTSSLTGGPNSRETVSRQTRQ